MASPAKSPKQEPPADEVPSFDNDPDVDMANNEDGPANEGDGAAAETNEMNLDGAADDPEREARVQSLEAAIQNQQNLPMRKDISLREFLNRMDDCAPIIPDAVTAHALTLAGLPPPPLGKGSSESQDPNTTPLHLSRLLALATQKFVADIAADAYQYSRMRSGNLTSNTLSAMSNPGAAMMGAAPGPGEGGGGAGGKAADKGKQSGQHVLGMQRPGYGGGGQGGGSNRTVLTMEDLGMAVSEYGVNVKRGEFYR